MNSTDLLYFDKLKKLVLQCADIDHLMPSDCKILAAAVLKQTGKGISETTLKRLLGFARSNFKPSGFTLNALSQFCGYAHWEAFRAAAKATSKPILTESDAWTTIRQQAAKITRYTMQTLMNRSGVPYRQTIRRNFMAAHMRNFFQSGLQGTILMAPSGYGKTIALCHWIEDLATDDEQQYDHIVLFFSSSALVNGSVSKKNLNDWLLSALGVENTLNLAAAIEQDEKKFILVIDGFDEVLLKPHWFHLLMKEINDVLSLHRGASQFKVVLSMRLATWVNYRHELLEGQQNWFIGRSVTDHQPINVPLFSQEETAVLVQKNGWQSGYRCPELAANSLSYPLYFQLFYQALVSKPISNYQETPDIRELLQPYLLNKVFKGPLFTEKLLLVQGLIEKIDFSTQPCTVNKLLVNPLLRQFPLAYRDLLSLGYLSEINTSEDLQTRIFITFGNADFFHYAVALYVLSRHDHNFDETMLTTLVNLPLDCAHQLSVLKWCYLHTVKNGASLNLAFIAAFDFSPSAKSDLLFFIRRLYKKEFEGRVNSPARLFPNSPGVPVWSYLGSSPLPGTSVLNPSHG